MKMVEMKKMISTQISVKYEGNVLKTCFESIIWGVSGIYLCQKDGPPSPEEL